MAMAHLVLSAASDCFKVAERRGDGETLQGTKKRGGQRRASTQESINDARNIFSCCKLICFKVGFVTVLDLQDNRSYEQK